MAAIVPYVGRAVGSRAIQRTALGLGSLYGYNFIGDQVAHAYNNARAAYQEANRLANMITPVRLFHTPTRTPVRSTPMSRGRTRSRMRRKRGRSWSTPRRTPVRRRYSVRRSVRPHVSRGVGRTVMPSRVYFNTRSKWSYTNRLLGPMPGTGTRVKKKEYIDGAWQDLLGQNQLYSISLIRIPYSDVDDAYNVRHTGAVTLKGVKCTISYRIPDNTNFAPQVVRWAIIINKEAYTLTDLPISTVEFFKKTEETNLLNDSGDNFTDTETHVGYARRQINPNKYHIVRQGRFTLVKNSNATDSRAGGGNVQTDLYGTVNEWIPLNTQVKFPANDTLAASAYPVDHNLYFVYWVYQMDKTSAAGQPTGRYEVMVRVVNYWRDSGSF